MLVAVVGVYLRPLLRVRKALLVLAAQVVVEMVAQHPQQVLLEAQTQVVVAVEVHPEMQAALASSLSNTQ